MWLIIPKNTPSDIRDWGLSHDIEDFIGVHDSPATDTLGLLTCPKGKEGYDYILKQLAKCEVWVLDPRSRVVVDGQTPSIPQDLANAVTNIFVHFGGTPSNDMNLLWIDQQWKVTWRDLHLPDMLNAVVLPISSQGGVPWQQQITAFRAAFTSHTPFNIDCLKSAWAVAEQHFYKLLPIRRVVETLFPYYVDASHFLSLSPDEKKQWKGDLANARRAAEEAVALVKQNPAIGEESALELVEILQSTVDAVFPPNSKVSGDDLKKFITSYKTLSTKYTKMVLKSPVVEAHQAQMEPDPEK